MISRSDIEKWYRDYISGKINAADVETLAKQEMDDEAEDLFITLFGRRREP